MMIGINMVYLCMKNMKCINGDYNVIPMILIVVYTIMYLNSYRSSPMGQMVIDGKGVDSIGTCQTAVITGFESHPLKL